MNARRRVVVATADPVTSRMPGPAIRAWHIAEALSQEHEVQLVTPLACDRSHPRFTARSVTADDWRELEQWLDVLVLQGGLLRDQPALIRSSKVIVADIYDPFHLENLEQGRGSPMESRRQTISHLSGVLNEQLLRGDFFVCASERQRDFWLGSLAALHRINPDIYDEDPTLARLLAIVPFGFQAEPPVHDGPVLRGVVDGIGEDDKIVLWAGGVYNWFDPLTVVRAIDRLRTTVPNVRLFFMGMRHPNPHIPEMEVAVSLRALSDKLGLTGHHVFFNDTWVEYDCRASYLLEADVGVSTHLGHIETTYSFRTRVLDYFWASLPTVATTGDTLSDLIRTEALGAVVPPGDVDALVRALELLLTNPAAAEACRRAIARVAPQFTWERVLEPIVAFCRDPRRAPDLLVAEQMSAAAPVANAPEPTVTRRRIPPTRLRSAVGNVLRRVGLRA